LIALKNPIFSRMNLSPRIPCGLHPETAGARGRNILKAAA
jgi:hypothetical protein